MAGARSVDRVQVCRIRTLLPEPVLGWLIRQTRPHSDARHVHVSLSLLFNDYDAGPMNGKCCLTSCPRCR